MMTDHLGDPPRRARAQRAGSPVISRLSQSAAYVPPTRRIGNPFVKIVAIEVIRLSLAFDAGRRPVTGAEQAAADTYNAADRTLRRMESLLVRLTDDAGRVEATRALFTQLESELQVEPSVPVGTKVGTVDTAWGDNVDVVTDADASVVLWNGGAGTVTSDLALGDHRDSGDTVGELSVQGPLNSATVDVSLAGDIEPPTAWWRLTHPLELFGLAG